MLSDSGLAGRVGRAEALQLSITGRFPLMSEAELHMMRARLRGGLLNAARRGELKVALPVGLVYDPLGHVVLDPDEQVQHSLRLVFDTFTGAGFPAMNRLTLARIDLDPPEIETFDVTESAGAG